MYRLKKDIKIGLDTSMAGEESEFVGRCVCSRGFAGYGIIYNDKHDEFAICGGNHLLKFVTYKNLTPMSPNRTPPGSPWASSDDQISSPIFSYNNSNDVSVGHQQRQQHSTAVTKMKSLSFFSSPRSNGSPFHSK